MKVALIIPYKNRFDYLKKCLDSIDRSDIPNGLYFLLVNDGSDEIMGFEISEFKKLAKCKIETVINNKSLGIKGVLKFGFDKCFAMGYDVVISLDSDTIVTEDFFSRILQLRSMFKGNIVCGINATNYDNGVLRNPIISEYEGFIFKKFTNGQCLCLNLESYNTFIKPALSMNGNWDYNASILCQKNNTSVVVAKPTLVQHIGVISAMNHTTYGEPDVALDFPKIKLPNVTLFAVDAHDPQGILRAAEICQRHIEFGAVKIITERIFDGRDGYSVFCIKDMWKYIETDFVLLVHSDGYLQNAWAWDESWLGYDYIGGTWGYKDNMNVGNGGFTLRSKKLLNAIKDFDVPHGTIEDDFICRKKRKELEVVHGIKFAPEEVANKFSIEAYGASLFTDMQGHKANTYTGQWGFHGYQVHGLPIPPTKKIPTIKPRPIHKTPIKKPLTRRPIPKRTYRK